jgi:hypothetical protein
MKKLILILLLSISIISTAQMAISNELVVTTPARDTLYVINNPQGQIIYAEWLRDPEYDGYSPKVFLVPSLEPYRCCAANKKCKRKKRK